MLPHLKFRQRLAMQRGLRHELLPVKLQLGGGGAPTLIRFSDRSQSTAVCLRCHDAPCLYYAVEELIIPLLPDFPSDRNIEVCPTKALVWPFNSQSGPSVMEGECIGCGLCAARCPLGAIFLGDDGRAHVSDSNTRQFYESSTVDSKKERRKFFSAMHIGCIQRESNEVLTSIMKRVLEATKTSGPKFPNLFMRNLIAATGWHATIRRTGDTNVRMDVLASKGKVLCTAEVEFSDQLIDAPRCVLDNLAVLISRYGYKHSLLRGSVLALILPNQRSDYWQVISDIEQALKIRIYTLSLGALLLLLWNRAELGKKAPLPFANPDSPGIRCFIEKEIGRSIEISAGCAAALESSK